MHQVVSARTKYPTHTLTWTQAHTQNVNRCVKLNAREQTFITEIVDSYLIHSVMTDMEIYATRLISANELAE